MHAAASHSGSTVMPPNVAIKNTFKLACSLHLPALQSMRRIVVDLEGHSTADRMMEAVVGVVRVHLQVEDVLSV